MTNVFDVGKLIERVRADWAPRRSVMSLVDGAAWAVAIPVGAALRLDFDFGQVTLGGMLTMIVFAITANTVLGLLGGHYRGRWRVGSIDEAMGLAALAAVVTILLAVVAVLLDRPVPVGAVFVAGSLALLVIGTSRVVYRLMVESFDSTVEGRRMIVFGAGEAAAQVIASILTDRNSPFRPVALIDDAPQNARRTIRGVRVEGTREDISTVAARHEADVLLIASPEADSDTIRTLSALGLAAKLEVLVLPPASELYGTITAGDIRSLTEEDLLGRRPVETNVEQIAGYLSGRTVLVTGAGGSIGSELCRQLHALRPSNLVMVDRDESALHAVQLAITGRALLDSDELVVADIRDRNRMRDVFARWRPEVVFHAAALKHLPLLEKHPEEGFKTNVDGTLNVLDAAADVGVQRFVNISTDKAADPTSVLGYTKRIAERLTSYYSAKHPGVFLSVRFGNVLGSRGSVLTAFRRQIELGGPVTVTHEHVSRYFMTVEEASQLVIQAGAVGADGEALVLDMGQPVSIADVARQMIAATGEDIEVVYTGLRPGEKLHEVLLGADEVDVRPAHPLISHTDVPALDPLELEAIVGGDGSSVDIEGMIRMCGNRARRWSEAVGTVEDHVSSGGLLDLTAPTLPPIRIRLASPMLGEQELQAVGEVFSSGVLTNGPRTVDFERAFAARHGVAHAVAVANGTVALQAMFRALGIGPGDEVIVPSLTFVSSATSILHVGATPVWADIEEHTFNIDPDHVAKLITPRTRAVLAVHYGGQPADMDRLAEVCSTYGIALLEDAAEAHGASFRGRPVGGIGRAGIFSFTPTKNITTGEGGMITTDDAALADALRLLRNHGQTALYRHDSLGYNWRMTEMQAAIGCVQLAKLDAILERKRELAHWMSERLSGLPGVHPPVIADGRDHSFMLYTLRIDRCRDRFLSSLLGAGIEARIYFPPAHRQPAFGSLPPVLPVTDRVAEQILSIPMHAGLSLEELDEIAVTIEKTAGSTINGIALAD